MYALKLLGGCEPLNLIVPPRRARGEAQGSAVSVHPSAGYHVSAAENPEKRSEKRKIKFFPTRRGNCDILYINLDLGL